MNPPEIEPWDEHNRRLVDHVHPADWKNPRPAPRYNLVVVGAGPAGLVAASAAAGLGARVALVERSFLGGDCLNSGCVPSKALLSCARTIATLRNAGKFGIHVPPGTSVDFTAVMERMRRLRADLSVHDSARRFADMGVDVFLGNGAFTASDCLEVAGCKLHFHRAVIATGARAATPAIPGLKAIRHLTNENLFSLTKLPRRLGIIGSGPVGCEMAQCFARFGSEVSMFESSGGILQRESRDAAEIVKSAMIRDGIRFAGKGRSVSILSRNQEILLQCQNPQGATEVSVDELLIATGRAPNLESLNLEQAGVEFNEHGVCVNKHLRTSNPLIFACGDVCSRFQFTHAADFMARIVVQNALFGGKADVGSLVIPWCTYTSPEVARIGLNEAEAEKLEIQITSFTQPMDRVDRAILEEETDGFVRIHARKGTDKIVGATIVGANAGELIGTIALTMRSGLGLKTLASAIHPYPTRAEALRKTGDLFNRTRLTPVVSKLLRHWLDWQRR